MSPQGWKSWRLAGFLGLVLVGLQDLRADALISFEVSLQSPDFPDFDADPSIIAEAGTEFEFSAQVKIRTSGLREGEGVAGWSWGLWHGGTELISITTEGTAAAPASRGGLLNDRNSFRVHEVARPEKSGGRTGVVQAVVLDLIDNTTLPPNTTQVIARHSYRAAVQTPGTIAFIRFTSSLVGSGQPVPMNATIGARSAQCVCSHREITVGQDTVPELTGCDDGIDNDRDGYLDSDDPDCWNGDPCTLEDCDDGEDNDHDGLTDCQDRDCAHDWYCSPVPELCSDGEDNDRDGLADCDDPDCADEWHCPLLFEVCDDGEDNDRDTLIDCDDWDCRGKPPCPPGEACNDGLDNDDDGVVDCDDPDCHDAPVCYEGKPRFDLVVLAEGARREGGLNVVEVDYEHQETVEVTAYAAPFPERGWDPDTEWDLEPHLRYVDGWALGVSHETEVMDLVLEGGGPTIEGTDAMTAMGDFFFFRLEPVDPVDGDPERGYGGFIFVAVISHRPLYPAYALSLVRAQYRLRDQVGSPGTPPATVRFRDYGLESGHPLENQVNFPHALSTPRALVPLEFRRAEQAALEAEPFVRGDANSDGLVNIADAIWSINHLTRGGPESRCPRAADINADGIENLSDPVYLIRWRYLQGPSIPAPFPECGLATTASQLECAAGSVPYCP